MGEMMLKQRYPAVNVNGMQINRDGSPSTRAIASMINALITQLNSLSDDINAMRPQLSTMQTAIDQINRNTTPAVLRSMGQTRSAVSEVAGMTMPHRTTSPFNTR